MENTNTPVVKKYQLPKINDIINADLLKLDEINDLNILLNQPPPEKWLRQNPMCPSVKYLPIEFVEFLLTKIFFRWRVEIKKTQLIGNSVTMEIRLHYFNPVLDEWEWQDGVGATPLQTDHGAGAIEFNKIKNNAVMLAAPAAKSYAVKDAAEQIGAIFGKNLNRADKISYDSLSENPAFKAKESKLETLFE